MYFSGHVIDAYSAALTAKKCTPICEIFDAFSENEEGDEHFFDGARVTVGGVITRRVDKALKNGSNMAIITLEDRYGEIDTVAFSKVCDTYGRHLVRENAVSVSGKISIRDGQRPEIVIYSVEPLSQNDDVPVPKSTVPKRLFLRVRSLDSDECRNAISLLERYPGEIEVAVYDRAAARYVSVAGKRVFVTDELLAALVRSLGEENVVYK